MAWNEVLDPFSGSGTIFLGARETNPEAGSSNLSGSPSPVFLQVGQLPKKKHPGSTSLTVSQEMKLRPHLVPKPLWSKSAANLIETRCLGAYKERRLASGASRLPSVSNSQTFADFLKAKDNVNPAVFEKFVERVGGALAAIEAVGLHHA